MSRLSQILEDQLHLPMGEDVVVETMLATSITIGEDMETMETGANGRRGVWGNRWEYLY